MLFFQPLLALLPSPLVRLVAIEACVYRVWHQSVRFTSDLQVECGDTRVKHGLNPTARAGYKLCDIGGVMGVVRRGVMVALGPHGNRVLVVTGKAGSGVVEYVVDFMTEIGWHLQVCSRQERHSMLVSWLVGLETSSCLIMDEFSLADEDLIDKLALAITALPGHGGLMVLCCRDTSVASWVHRLDPRSTCVDVARTVGLCESRSVDLE